MATGQAERNFIGLAQQATFGTAITSMSAFKFFPARAASLKEVKPSKPSDQMFGSEPQWARKQNSNCEGSFSIDSYYEGLGLLLYSFLQRSSSTEVASYVATLTTQDTINFREDGVNDFSATITPGTYTTTTLLAELKTQLEAEGAGTYTCTYTAATGLFNIAVAGGASTVQFLGTGDFESIIGFTAASSDAASISSDTAAFAVYDHIFIPVRSNQLLSAQSMTKGLTMLNNMDLVTQQGDSLFLTQLGMIWAENDPHAPNITGTLKGRYSQEISEVTLPSGVLNDIPGNPDGNFDIDITINGTSYPNHCVKNVTFTLTNAVDMRWCIGSTKPSKAIKTGKYGGTLGFAWDFESDDNLRTDFLAVWEDTDATALITFHQDGEIIRGAIKQGITVSMPACRPMGDTATPAAGTIEQPYNFMLERDTDNDAAMVTITLRNKEYLA